MSRKTVTLSQTTKPCMKLFFHIDYRTVFGEELLVHLLDVDNTCDEHTKPYRMHTADGVHWECEVLLKQPATRITYYYTVVRGQEECRSEWRVRRHEVRLEPAPATVRLYDRWADMPQDSFLFSSAFTECISRHSVQPMQRMFRRTLRLKVCAPQLEAGQDLVLVGADTLLGGWNSLQGVKMQLESPCEWVALLDASKLSSERLEFKFCAVKGEEVIWEDSFNRVLSRYTIADGEVYSCELSEARFSLPPQRCAGTLVPLFSLRSEGSFGVGDFGDLRLMIDWVRQTGQSVLQVLPVNDTTTTHTWTDSYPYSSISIFALHPQYADFRSLPPLKDKQKRAEFEALRRSLNALPTVDYEQVNHAKTAYLRLLFAQERAVLESDDFRAFFAENEQWLVPYAQYCVLREEHGTYVFHRWEGHEQWHEADRKALSTPGSPEYEKSAFYYYVQYILCRQMRAARDYARSQGVVLKGDIPIGVNRNGCDVWAEPRYFHLDAQAGAPPDDFSADGQNWGLPTYNWDEMLKDGCVWWVRRFRNMQQYFDAYRIDHVLGFFRIWEIPADAVYGLLGHFSPALGMTREEIEGYGLHWQEALFTEPFIADWALERMFGAEAETVRTHYLLPKDKGQYRLKADFDTQQKIEKAFAQRTSPADQALKRGLQALVSDVLFVRDHRQAHLFHPRIGVQHDFIYEWLYDSDKAIFNRLYNDYFYRRNNQFWYQEAMKKLPRLSEATRMLVCAEDLGMVPACVPWVMEQLHILSLEIQWMPKSPQHRFGCLSENPYASVAMISTHDMPTLRIWWDEDRERAQEYYNTVLQHGGDAPHPLPGWLAEEIVAQHLYSPSMLCVLALQDWMSMDEQLRTPDAAGERVNVPANPHHYWRYRMHVNIEELLQNSNFSTHIRKLVEQSKR